jgi:hypothetical protein
VLNIMRIPGYWGVLAAFGCLLAACGGHRLPPPSTDIDENAFRSHLRMLASDGFEGRKPGTPGEEKTVAYLSDQFRKLGLKPGNGDSFVQQVPMEWRRAHPGLRQGHGHLEQTCPAAGRPAAQ